MEPGKADSLAATRRVRPTLCLAFAPTRVPTFHLYVARHEHQPCSAHRPCPHHRAASSAQECARGRRWCILCPCSAGSPSTPAHGPQPFFSQRSTPAGTRSPDRAALLRGISLCLPVLPRHPSHPAHLYAADAARRSPWTLRRPPARCLPAPCAPQSRESRRTARCSVRNTAWVIPKAKLRCSRTNRVLLVPCAGDLPCLPRIMAIQPPFDAAGIHGGDGRASQDGRWPNTGSLRSRRSPLPLFLTTATLRDTPCCIPCRAGTCWYIPALPLRSTRWTSLLCRT